MSALTMARRLAGPAVAATVLAAAVNGIVNGQGFTLVGDQKTLTFPEVIEQPDQISCGPTAVAMVLQYYGINAGIGPLKTAAGSRWIQAGDFKLGLTLPLGVLKALQSRGVGANVYNGGLRDLTNAIDEGKPPILLVRSARGLWHYIVVTGYSSGGDSFRIHDPGGSVYWISGADLQQTWQFSGDLRSDGSGRGWSDRIKGLRCDVCAGSGRVNAPDPNLECVICSGSGRVKIVLDTPFGRVKQGLGRCNTCGGSGRWKGKLPKINCVVCSGRGTLGDPQRKAVEQFARGSTMIVPNSPPAGREPRDSKMGANGPSTPQLATREFKNRLLRVVNNTGDPLEVRLQYFKDGRWHPTPPGPNSRYLTYKLPPGRTTYLNHDNRRIEASVICIRGIAGRRQWNEHWVNKLPISRGTYSAGKIATHTYTFNSAPPVASQTR